MESREQRMERIAEEEREYAAEMAAQVAEEDRRALAWESDPDPLKPPIFVPYGVGWDRYGR